MHVADTFNTRTDQVGCDLNDLLRPGTLLHDPHLSVSGRNKNPNCGFPGSISTCTWLRSRVYSSNLDPIHAAS